MLYFISQRAEDDDISFLALSARGLLQEDKAYHVPSFARLQRT